MGTSAAWPADAARFLLKVWRRHHKTGFAFIGVRNAKRGAWKEYPVKLPVRLQELHRLLGSIDPLRNDIYFCPNIFRRAQRLKRYALPTPFSWSDIDDGDPARCRPRPSLIIKTSPGRYQALWLWDEAESVETAEDYSRRLTDMARGDRNGWSITKYLRLPGSFNHKVQYNRPAVRLTSEKWDESSHRPARNSIRVLARSLADIDDNETPRLPDSSTVLAKYRRRLHPHTRSLIQDKRLFTSDRSKAVYEIAVGLRVLGASRTEIMGLLRDNVYFRDKWGDSHTALSRELDRILAKCRRTP